MSTREKLENIKKFNENKSQQVDNPILPAIVIFVILAIILFASLK